MEDDVFLKEFYSFVFKKLGFAADILEDGDLFSQKLKSEKYDLILMDLSLKNTHLDGKKVDGVILSRLVKEDDALKHIPIVLVTAHLVDYHSKHLFHESLADDYIIKPISDVHIFIDKINSIIDKPK
ncbi:MAG: response regulator [Melioribacteraceae bacterium]|jgi:two-component system cell cycle response regulator DivK|nr:response regulator [Melioribacteraceae bacterium]